MHQDLNETETLDRFRRFFETKEQFKVSIESDSLDLFHHVSVAFFEPGFSRPFKGGGADAQKNLALVKAMGEALERRDFYRAEPDIRAVSYRQLHADGKACIDPESFSIFSRDQLCVQEGDARILDRDSEIDWIWFNDALDPDKQILLPSHFGVWSTLCPPMYFLSSTSGNACHSVATIAQVRAVSELLERDAFLVYWWTKNPPPKIVFPKESVVWPENCRNIRENVSFFYLRTEFEVCPSILAVYRGDRASGEPAFLFTACCHADPRQALLGALNELSQSYNYFHKTKEYYSRMDYQSNFEKSVWEFTDHVGLYSLNPPAGACDFIFSEQGPQIELKDIPHRLFSNHDELLAKICDEFRRHGLRLFFKNLTSADAEQAGFCVYRAFSPDLIPLEGAHRYRPLGVRRLFSLNDKLELPQRPKTFSQLNPMPHPFP